jgi:hypothetical protein
MVAFESALHLFPLNRGFGKAISLESWNERDLWRGRYGGMADGLLFFAQDTFGGQFAMSAAGIVSFDPETGAVTLIGKDLEDWAAQILADYEQLTGFPLAHAWQVRHGRLAVTDRLLPKRPFVLGGEYTIENLYVLDAVQGMRLRSELARQIATLPDGAEVNFKIVR